ncbi:MAG: hypothetical protein V3V09_05430 [Arenicellales bacterium]
MPSSNINPPIKAPKLLWAIGIISLLWNAMSAMDYVMTQTKHEAYMSQFSPEQLAFFYSFPSWAVASWAIAVWGGVLGSILLLFRKRQALWAFLISLVAMVITAFQNYVLSNGLEVIKEPVLLAFTAVIFIIALGLVLYAKAMHRNGLLK